MTNNEWAIRAAFGEWNGRKVIGRESQRNTKKKFMQRRIGRKTYSRTVSSPEKMFLRRKKKFPAKGM